jgi:hypothetical protein
MTPTDISLIQINHEERREPMLKQTSKLRSMMPQDDEPTS